MGHFLFHFSFPSYTSHTPANDTSIIITNTQDLMAAIDTAGVAVITGGASGFGFVMAQRLVEKGMKVAVLGAAR